MGIVSEDEILSGKWLFESIKMLFAEFMKASYNHSSQKIQKLPKYALQTVSPKMTIWIKHFPNFFPKKLFETIKLSSFPT